MNALTSDVDVFLVNHRVHSHTWDTQWFHILINNISIYLEINRHYVRENQWIHSSFFPLWCQLISWEIWVLFSASVDIDSIVAFASKLSSIVLMLVFIIVMIITICPSHFLACFWSERGYKKHLLSHRYENNSFVSCLIWLKISFLNWALTSSWCFCLTWFCITDRLRKMIQYSR